MLYQSNVLYSQLSVNGFRDKAEAIRNEYTPVELVQTSALHSTLD